MRYALCAPRSAHNDKVLDKARAFFILTNSIFTKVKV